MYVYNMAVNNVGSYQLTEKIAEGGMGMVVKARDLNLLRDVAIKV